MHFNRKVAILGATGAVGHDAQSTCRSDGGSGSVSQPGSAGYIIDTPFKGGEDSPLLS